MLWTAAGKTLTPLPNLHNVRSRHRDPCQFGEGIKVRSAVTVGQNQMRYSGLVLVKLCCLKVLGFDRVEIISPHIHNHDDVELLIVSES